MAEIDFPTRLSRQDISWVLRPLPAWCHVLHVIKPKCREDDLSRREITCFRCGQKGHKKQECRTWKTKRCSNPNCKLGLACSFAHSDAELRAPWIAKCVRVIRESGQMRVIGCGKIGRTYRECCQNESTAAFTLLKTCKPCKTLP